MPIEDNFLHVNFGPADPQTVEKSEVTSFHVSVVFLKRVITNSMLGAEGAFQGMACVFVCAARFWNDPPHVDKAMHHAMVNL